MCLVSLVLKHIFLHSVTAIAATMILLHDSVVSPHIEVLGEDDCLPVITYLNMNPTSVLPLTPTNDTHMITYLNMNPTSITITYLNMDPTPIKTLIKNLEYFFVFTS